MSLLPPSPPSQIPRLFIGGLSPSVPDLAVSNLLSRFGVPRQLSRAADGTYAHVSLETDKPDRCIAALQNTIWCGTSLRVQRAKEHFATKMCREWEEEANPPADPASEGKQTEDGNDSKPSKRSAAFKGLHKRFDFADLDVSGGLVDFPEEDALLGPDGQLCAAATAVERSAPTTKAISPLKRPSEKRAPRITKALSSTLELFGLSDTAPTETSTTPHGDAESRQREEPEHAKENPRLKRRRVEGSGLDANYLKMLEREPGLVDWDKEKTAALSVLNGMFPARSVQDVVRACRRLGLYRKLVAARVAGHAAAKGGKLLQRGGRQTKNKQRIATSRKVPTVDPTLPGSTRELKTAATGEPTSHRRAGLYKQLRSAPR